MCRHRPNTLPVKPCFTGFGLDFSVDAVRECVLCLVHNCTGNDALNINDSNMLSSSEGARLIQKTEYRDSSMMTIAPDHRGGIAQQAEIGEDSVQWILDENKVVEKKPSAVISINGAATVSGSLENVYDMTVLVVSHHPELIKWYGPQYVKKRYDRGRPVMDARDGVPMFNVRSAQDDVAMVGVIFPVTRAPWAKSDPSVFKPIRYNPASAAGDGDKERDIGMLPALNAMTESVDFGRELSSASSAGHRSYTCISHLGRFVLLSR